MKIWRITYRVLALLGLTVLASLAILLGFVFLLAKPVWRQSYRAHCVSLWARSCATVMGMRLRVQGQPPSCPFILVSNHLSYVDIIAYFAVLPCRFVAKSEVRSWPLLGQMAQVGGTLFVNRRRKRDLLRVNERMQTALLHKSGLVFFPEGTSTSGATILPFKPALLDHAARAHVPVSVATLHYRSHDSHHPAHLRVCWWGDMTFAGHFPGLLALPGFDAHIQFSPQTIQSDDRKELAQKAWQSAIQVFTPTHHATLHADMKGHST